MTKDQENAIKNLESFIDHFQTLIKQADKANDEAFDREKAEQDIIDFKIAIQSIIDLDKMNGIALDLASENDDLIEKLDAIRAEIAEMIEQETIFDTDNSRAQIIALEWVIETIDKYRKGGDKDAGVD